MAKKKIKKLLKGLGIGAALLGAGKALMNRNARASTTADAIKAMTSNAAYSDSSLPAMLTKNMGKRKRGSVLADPKINKMDLSEVDLDYMAPDMSAYRNMDMGLEGYYKKGGRVRKTKKGGRAVRKASRSKKK